MSGTLRTIPKKKYTQHDLRKIMNQQKTTSRKIDSPLAKYNELGQLMCILCKSVVRSEDVWKVHINAKQHKQNVELAKQLKEKTNNFTAPVRKPVTTISTAESAQTIEGPPKKKLKESTTLPSNFFDSASAATSSAIKSKIETPDFFEVTLQKTSIRKDLININKRNVVATNDSPINTETIIKNNELETDSNRQRDSQLNNSTFDPNDQLPEGFFDDPVKDAKARNLEYKNPIDEEWEKFQKEIKEADNFSNAIIAEDQEEATAERQIDEIDEQIRNWSRVLNLEKKKEEIVEKEKLPKSREFLSRNIDSDTESTSSTDDFDEYLDWRSKKSHK